MHPKDKENMVAISLSRLSNFWIILTVSAFLPSFFVIGGTTLLMDSSSEPVYAEKSIDSSGTVAQAETTVAIKFEEIISGLDTPVDIQHAGDDRLFIIEKPGRVRILDGSDNLISTPFLDIENRVEDEGFEEGLLGLAFHPEYATNGYFYLNYTISSPNRTRISRFEVSANDENIAELSSELVLMEFEQPFANHNGGQIQFGPDGYLYIATGDGGSGGDPNNAGQDSTQVLGKILRIDVNGGGGSAPECDLSGGANYAIPANNPFVDGAGGNCDEIWSTGLRNPWRFSFDSQTGDMWIGDVGQGEREEINFQSGSSAGGENYGWRCFEGNASYDSSGCQPASAYVAPAYDYEHADGHCSVTGGMVYRGIRYAELAGHYFFADYCSSVYWTLSGNPLSPTLTIPDIIDESASNPSAFGVDAQGELYVASASGGAIYHVQGMQAGTTPIPLDMNPNYLPLMIKE